MECEDENGQMYSCVGFAFEFLHTSHASTP